MALAMVVGNVIGSGIFLKPGIIAQKTGDFSLIITAWIVGGVVCILGALCFAELAAMLPRAGGLYVYLREAYGRRVAFLYGWSEFLFGKPASIGALSVAFVVVLKELSGWKSGPVSDVVIALALIVVMAWINIVGVIWGGRMQASTTLIKAVALAVVAVLPFALVIMGLSGFEWSNYRTTLDVSGDAADTANTATRFAAAMLAVMWAYNGWHGVTPVAEEVRNPGRNIPLALFGGIGILIVLYVGANFAYHGVLTMSEMAATAEPKTTSQEMMRKLFLSHGESSAQLAVAAISAVIMCSLFGAINSNMLNGPRVSFAMGRDGLFFRDLGRVHVNYRTPAVAIFVQAVMSSLLIIGAAIVVRNVESLKDKNVFDMLTDYVVFSASIFYVLAILSVIVLRRKHPEWDRPFRTLGYPVVPIVYVGFYVWFLSQVYLGKPFEAWTGIVLISLGLPVFYGWQKWSARHQEDVTDGQ
jgi:APA family basic amino acid/polyamine antiporter